ncbi:MAG TPA: hypothetical protein VH249_05250 [Xanthobacteraceae bacterium]|nr:hypothetical protein [Xanthobacteraceae bacterium]
MLFVPPTPRDQRALTIVADLYGIAVIVPAPAPRAATEADLRNKKGNLRRDYFRARDRDRRRHNVERRQQRRGEREDRMNRGQVAPNSMH